MIIQPSEQPGTYERHLWRKVNNPLFPTFTVDDDALLDAQRLDYEARQTFEKTLRALLEEVSSLDGKVDSAVILKLKDRLDQAFELSAGLGGDQSQAQDAMRKLLRFMMASVRRGAGNDPHAHTELDQEEAAREAHFTLLQSKLVADLLNPASPIQPDELVPTLLSASKDDLQLALQLFDEMQLLAILTQGAELLQRLQTQGVNVPSAQENLAFIQGYAEFVGVTFAPQA